MGILVVLGDASMPWGWLSGWLLLCIVMMHGEYDVGHKGMAMAVVVFAAAIIVLLFSFDVSAS